MIVGKHEWEEDGSVSVGNVIERAKVIWSRFKTTSTDRTQFFPTMKHETVLKMSLLENEDHHNSYEDHERIE